MVKSGGRAAGWCPCCGCRALTDTEARLVVAVGASGTRGMTMGQMLEVSGLQPRTVTRLLRRASDLFETRAVLRYGAKVWGLTSKGREIIGRIKRTQEAAA